ncbi:MULTISPECIES: TetR/AcrR family transcriptional regulator [Streptomyces]|uniref:TetR/AcrR family transcriptional regulator n=1 Tax=Streptomyces TaxID=1883 RepID=UPI001E59B3C7|nr:TetR/AcrR family transcriptional regulator [Streptomyces sp. 8ZJF_21]MCC4316201.1 TetR/AcrR family transcriptional regulator [Streptomyces malaysiensis]MCD9588043.1 TetR/AcrR family transcriptional regulator [Streptomyces sp. 8ZJF_21]
MASNKRSGMSEHRRHRLRLEISREAARLFWEHGVDGTSGDQIAEAVGLSTRTIWRHFRSKESCAEPIVTQGVEWEMSMLRSWPENLSLEEHIAAESTRYGREADEVNRADDMLAMKMILLADREPAIRTAWLMACDQVEREMAEIIAVRLKLPANDLQVRLHAAAASAALRVINEEIGAALLGGTDPREFADAPERVAHAVRNATGGAVGDPVTE